MHAVCDVWTAGEAGTDTWSNALAKVYYPTRDYAHSVSIRLRARGVTPEATSDSVMHRMDWDDVLEKVRTAMRIKYRPLLWTTSAAGEQQQHLAIVASYATVPDDYNVDRPCSILNDEVRDPQGDVVMSFYASIAMLTNVLNLTLVTPDVDLASTVITGFTVIPITSKPLVRAEETGHHQTTVAWAVNMLVSEFVKYQALIADAKTRCDTLIVNYEMSGVVHDNQRFEDMMYKYMGKQQARREKQIAPAIAADAEDIVIFSTWADRGGPRARGKRTPPDRRVVVNRTSRTHPTHKYTTTKHTHYRPRSYRVDAGTRRPRERLRLTADQ